MLQFVELHGDRAGYDDPAIVTGIGTIDGRRYMFIGHQKGRNTKENIQRNFGMPTPHGYVHYNYNWFWKKTLHFMIVYELRTQTHLTCMQVYKPSIFTAFDTEYWWSIFKSYSYRKALRLMEYADHHGFPIVTFIDTPGAYADLKSEELGQVCC